MKANINPRGPLCLALALSLLIGCSEQAPESPTPTEVAVVDETVADAPESTDEQTGEKEPDAAAGVLLASQSLTYAEINESFITAATPEGTLDSPALWQAADGTGWLFATAKSADRLMMYDGDSGLIKGYFGESGSEARQFSRPNGIYVINNLLLVVERDNRRVQVFGQPGMTALGSFGGETLRAPYGIWARSLAEGIEVIVSDSYMSASDADTVPPLEELDRRFHRFKLQVRDGEMTVEARGSFGATDAAGAVRIAESMAGDVNQNRLLIAEEDQDSGTRIKIYDLDGFYTGKDMGADLFKAQVEGMALYECADGSGYWIATDQFKDRSLFHLFDRQSLALVGSFAGKTTANTDGVWLQQAPTKAFPKGVFYAVHDDQAVAAFDWAAIAAATGVRASCE